MSSTEEALFDGQTVRRSVRFNHDHIKPDHPTFGLPWRVIDRETGEQTFARSITSRDVLFVTELETVEGADGKPEIKGNIIVFGVFYQTPEKDMFIE